MRKAMPLAWPMPWRNLNDKTHEERSPSWKLLKSSILEQATDFAQQATPRVALWESEDSTAWTVIYEQDPWFASSCLNRLVFVKPLPGDLAGALGPALPWVAAIGIWPVTPENAKHAARLNPSRICPLGQMQSPPLSWHQEGRQTLAPLVRWVDFETNLR